MKRKSLSLLLLPVLMLASCGGTNHLTIEEMVDHVAALETPTNVTVYDIAVKGHVVEFPSFAEPIQGNYIDVNATNAAAAGYSYILEAPMVINTANFYDADAVAGSCYGYIQTVFQPKGDNIHLMYTYLEEDNLVFEVDNRSGIVEFFHVVLPDFPDGDKVKLYGRYTMKLVYDHRGLLVHEEAMTVDYGKKPDNETVYAVADYTYKAE